MCAGVIDHTFCLTHARLYLHHVTSCETFDTFIVFFLYVDFFVFLFVKKEKKRSQSVSVCLFFRRQTHSWPESGCCVHVGSFCRDSLLTVVLFLMKQPLVCQCRYHGNVSCIHKRIHCWTLTSCWSESAIKMLKCVKNLRTGSPVLVGLGSCQSNLARVGNIP